MNKFISYQQIEPEGGSLRLDEDLCVWVPGMQTGSISPEALIAFAKDILAHFAVHETPEQELTKLKSLAWRDCTYGNVGFSKCQHFCAHVRELESQVFEQQLEKY